MNRLTSFTRRHVVAALVGALALGVGMIALPQSAMARDKDTNSLKGQAAPDFSLKTVDGKSVKLSQLKGDVVLIDFWATWCPPCRKSLPHVQELSADKARADKGLKVLAVNSGEKAPTVTKFLTANKYTFVVPMDSANKVGGDYLVQGIPTTVVVGRDGNVAAVFVGFGEGSGAAIDKAIDAALDAPRPGGKPASTR